MHYCLPYVNTIDIWSALNTLTLYVQVSFIAGMREIVRLCYHEALHTDAIINPASWYQQQERIAAICSRYGI